MPLRIAAIGDLHMRDTSSGTFRELFADISRNADLLLLCGDLTDHGFTREAEVLAGEIQTSCTIPVIGVLGNHDFEHGHPGEIRKILKEANMTFLEESPMELDGVGFAGGKGFCGGFDRHLLQAWGEEAVKFFVREGVEEALRLENSLAKLRTERKVVVLHYAPIPGTVEGEPKEIFPFLGSSRLAEPIDRYTVSMVFHGHAHNGMFEGKTTKGIPVYNVALPLLRRMNPSRPYVVMTL